MDADTQVELIAAHHRDESQELLDEAASLDAIAQQNEIAANNSALSEQTRTDHAKQATLAREAARKLRARSARADEIANQWARVTAR